MFSKGGSPIKLESVPLSFKHEVGTAVCIEFDVDLKDAQGQQVVLVDNLGLYHILKKLKLSTKLSSISIAVVN